MRVLITGAAGFVGSSLARGLTEAMAGVEIVGLDNLGRAGSETNRGALTTLDLEVDDGAFRPAPGPGPVPPGVTPAGISEECATTSPVSLYGASKLASEQVALEYGDAFELPCG